MGGTTTPPIECFVLCDWCFWVDKYNHLIVFLVQEVAMAYNLISEKVSNGYIFKLYVLKNVQWGKKTEERFFVEKWNMDSALEPQVALEEKWEYKSRTSAMNRMKKA